jgi:hypothetical protein
MTRLFWLIIFAFATSAKMLFSWLEAEAEERVKGERAKEKDDA